MRHALCLPAGGQALSAKKEGVENAKGKEDFNR
jgi:hypothetical protein